MDDFCLKKGDSWSTQVSLECSFPPPPRPREYPDLVPRFSLLLVEMVRTRTTLMNNQWTTQDTNLRHIEGR